MEWALAVDVVQLDTDPCMPGKQIIVGTKEYSPLAPYDQCTDNHWRDDGCRITTRPGMTTHTIYPMRPRLENFPDDYSTDTAGSIGVDVAGRPTGNGFCTTPFEIYRTDSEPARLTTSDFCGWRIVRTWTIRPVYKDCLLGVPPDSPLSTSRDQNIYVADVTPPVFTTAPEPSVRVPFFSNYRAKTTIPAVEDRAQATYFQDVLGLVATPVTLTSSDSDLVLARDTDAAQQSIADGIARFTRTWTISDACQNTHTAVQQISIEHPPSVMQPVQPMVAGSWQLATDVVQMKDLCRPGKAISFGNKA